MKIFLPLLFFLGLSACSPLVRKIDDKVRNEVTYLWSTQRSLSSGIHKMNRYFHINVKKKQSVDDYIYINILSSYPITQPDYFDTVYLVLPNQNLPFPFKRVSENIQYREKINYIATSTNVNTAIKVENTTVTVPVENKTYQLSSQEQKTDTKTTTSTTTNSATKVTSEILDKIKSERQIIVNVNSLKYALKSPSFKIRLYTENDDDFWDIKFTGNDILKLNQLIHQLSDNH
jgi:hypothetical protein